MYIPHDVCVKFEQGLADFPIVLQSTILREFMVESCFMKEERYHCNLILVGRDDEKNDRCRILHLTKMYTPEGEFLLNREILQRQYWLLVQ